MQYDWRAHKNELNIEVRGIAIVWAMQIWDGAVLDTPSPREHSTERRRLALGRVSDRVIAVVYVLVGDDVRHISSARHSSRQERRRYAAHTT